MNTKTESSPASREAKPSVRERVLTVALELFTKHGYRVTGVDAIVAASGVAKMSLYTHFASKDALVVAAIRIYSERFRADLNDALERTLRPPEEKPLAFFDALEMRLQARVYWGCEFIRGITEFPDPEHPVHQAVLEHRQLCVPIYAKAFRQGGFAEIEELVGQIQVLLDGCLLGARVDDSIEPVLRARRTMQVLMRIALG